MFLKNPIVEACFFPEHNKTHVNSHQGSVLSLLLFLSYKHSCRCPGLHLIKSKALNGALWRNEHERIMRHHNSVPAQSKSKDVIVLVGPTYFPHHYQRVRS